MIDQPPAPARPRLPPRRELENALAQLQALGHGHALHPHAIQHVTTPEAEVACCTIRLSVHEASILWAAATIVLLMGAADG